MNRAILIHCDFVSNDSIVVIALVFSVISVDLVIYFLMFVVYLKYFAKIKHFALYLAVVSV